MTKKIKSAEYVRKVVPALKCPICGSTMQVVDLKSLLCMNRHTFDFAKQGYINMSAHSIKSNYGKGLFEARHSIIMESGLYDGMHETIAKMIRRHLDVSNPLMVADLGCGEGSHLQRIIDECQCSGMTGVGLDLSKEAIVLAAKRYEDPIWIVGDLARSPLESQSFDVILNILSPSNYKEFKRILTPDGLVIKVVPGPDYLKELRESLFHQNENKVIYRNDKTVTLFKKHFQLLDSIPLRYSRKLAKAELNHLGQMTPLAWNGDKARLDEFMNQDSAEITVDLELLFGTKKNEIDPNTLGKWR